MLIAELGYWTTRSVKFYENRTKAENAFMAIWKDQNISGVKEDKGADLAYPFDGASDQRVRWGDLAYQEFLALVIIALDGCKIEVTCPGTEEGAKRASAIQKIIKWCRKRLGAKWYMQVMTLMHYTLVDTPAVAAMSVEWAVKKTMGVVTLEFEDVQDEYAAWRVARDGNVAEEDAKAEFAVGCSGSDERCLDRVLEFLEEVKGVPEEYLEDVASALDEEHECECVAEASRWEGPEIVAMRYGDDFVFPALATDFDYASPLFRQEWYTEAQLREMAAEEDWDRSWLEETLEHKGASFYDRRDYHDMGDVKDLVNVVWCYTIDVNAEGTTTRYETLLSLANGSAFGKRVLRSRRGKWDMVFFRREALGANLTSSRGLAELTAPDQGLAKELRDYANDNAIVSCLPAYKCKGGRVHNVMLEPWAPIEMGQSDDISYMQPPPYPAAAKEMIQEMKDELFAFLGVSNGKTDVTNRTQSFVSIMLAQFRDLYTKLVECAQDYASDEALMSVTSTTDLTGLRHEDLDGEFQLSIEFNPKNMDHKDLIDRVTALGQVIAPLDLRNEIDRGAIVRNATVQLFPELADASFKSSDQMAADDVKDEQNNFVLIKSGVMPAMDTEGKWNYQARLQWHQQLQQENPDAIAEMSPRSQDIYTRWMQALEMQARQRGENAEIGRTGVRGVSSM